MHLLSVCRRCVNNTMWFLLIPCPRRRHGSCLSNGSDQNESWLNANVQLEAKTQLTVPEPSIYLNLKSLIFFFPIILLFPHILMNSFISLMVNVCLCLSLCSHSWAPLHNEWVSAPRQAQPRETHTKVGPHTPHTHWFALPETMLCFALCFQQSVSWHVQRLCVFTQVWHPVAAQDLQLLPWREKLPAEDSRGETDGRRREKKIFFLQLRRSSFDCVGLQAALLYEFGHMHEMLTAKLWDSRVNNEPSASFSSGVGSSPWFGSQRARLAVKPHTPL